MALQIIAIPFAVRVLGVETYGAYAAATALFAWMSLLEIGLGANLVKGMVATISRCDDAGTGTLFRSGLAIMIILAWTLSFVVLAAVWLWSTVNTPPGSQETLSLFTIAALLAAAQLSTAVITRARAALQQSYVNNLFGAAANLFSAFLLLILVKPGVSGVSLLLALNAPLVVVQVVNGVLMIRQNPGWTSSLKIDWDEGRAMLKGGVWLALAQAGVFLEREAPKLILAGVATAAVVGHYACAIQILMIMAGLVVMFSGPFMPAVADALERGEHNWWKRRTMWILFGVIGLGLISAVIMGVKGPLVVSWVFGETIKFQAWDLVGLVAWGTTVLLSHILYTVLVAAGRMRVVAQWQLIEGVVVVSAFALLYRTIGLGGMFWFAAGATMMWTLTPWLFAVMRLSNGCVEKEILVKRLE